jgi:hypothetical protein
VTVTNVFGETSLLGATAVTVGVAMVYVKWSLQLVPDGVELAVVTTVTSTVPASSQGDMAIM